MQIYFTSEYRCETLFICFSLHFNHVKYKKFWFEVNKELPHRHLKDTGKFFLFSFANENIYEMNNAFTCKDHVKYNFWWPAMS